MAEIEDADINVSLNYQQGDIVWVPFPFTDLSRTKVRPALIISNHMVNKTGDYLLMMITHVNKGDSLSLELNEGDFDGPPLPYKSYLRLHKIFILNRSLIERKVTASHQGAIEHVVFSITRLLR
ncbi:type II toxin-antitoxin system PemK/MazF family toxin [Pontibacter sp. 172403-2]|uniref:type II toxin-antitoxin system PemK/MazF family toxin n=1 Tax=Pontibacter rufus TaxID=2791028 RepID=UPI0018AF982B|nr:type II toxin-antitoxin system PemK/MazF family toxin [Pontibacter sp. 172403-2]MBF9253857.1 type II toxin-antitoxin system PemK/MazF family toxin [Pontibacter sp. 172403-2]